MYKDPKRDASGSIRTAVIIVSVTVAVLIGLFILGYSLLMRTSTMQDKDYILSSLEQSVQKNEESGSANVTSFLDDTGIGGYDRRKFRRVENYFRLYYPMELPTASEIARLTVTRFLDEYYDVIDLGDKTAVTDALIRCYVKATGDRWAVYRTALEYEEYEGDMSGSFVGIGVTVIFPEGEAVVPTVESVIKGSPAEESGIMRGDIITSVNGVSVQELGIDGLAPAIRGEEGTEVEITVLRGDITLEFTVTRRQVDEPTVMWEMLEGDIAYLAITRFKLSTDEQFISAIDEIEESGAVGIIFDLRSNPGGYLDSVVNALSYLVPYGTDIVSFKYKTSSQNTVYGAKDDHRITLPVALLCNENTASAGELFTAAIRDYRDSGFIDACIVGKTTYGKGVMQSTFELGGGAALTLTVSLYNPPSGENYEGEGVSPDTGLSVDYVQTENSDTQLDVAIRELRKLISIASGGMAA